MGKRLRDNITSGYFEAANKLNSKRARSKIIAYVQSYDDVFFWRMVLSRFEDDTRYFEVMLPTRSSKLERGKKAVLMNLLEGKTGDHLIACVDADYDYLMQGATTTSHEVIANPYVFHSYVYSIENYQCYGPSLHDVCVAVTLNDHAIFDFAEFLRLYSQAIFPLFVWSIWFYRTPHYGQFTISDFNHIVEFGNFGFRTWEESLARLRSKVGRKVEYLRHRHPEAKESYLRVKDDLKRLGVTADTTYLYIQGHHLFNNVVLPMLNKVCDRLIRERENEISRQSVHGTQRRNELSSYSNSLGDISTLLRKNLGYMDSAPFKRVLADVERYLKETKAGKTETPEEDGGEA